GAAHDQAGQHEHSVLGVIAGNQPRVACQKRNCMRLENLSEGPLVLMFRTYRITVTARGVDWSAKRHYGDKSCDTEEFNFHWDLPQTEVHNSRPTAREPATAAAC